MDDKDKEVASSQEEYRAQDSTGSDDRPLTHFGLKRSLLHKIRLPGTAHKYIFRKDPQIREQCTLLPEQCTLFPEDLPISMSSGKNAHTLYGNIVRPSWKSVHSSRKRIHRIFVRSSGNSVHSCIKMLREECTLFPKTYLYAVP